MATMCSQRSATKWRDETIVHLLEKVQRCRPLNEEEEGLLERTVRRLTPKREVWRWSEAEDQAIRKLLSKRPISGRYVRYGKPFRRNDEVRLLAIQLGRTEWAVRRRMERLRKAKRKANGSAQ